MAYNETVSRASQEIMDIIGIDEDDIENYESMYEEVFEIVEKATKDDDFNASYFNMLGLSDKEIGNILDILIDVNNNGHRGALTEDYEVKYARKNVSLEDIQDMAEIRKSKEQKSKIKGTPHFKYEDSEKKRIGVGERDYNVKYGKGGPLFESLIDYESIPGFHSYAEEDDLCCFCGEPATVVLSGTGYPGKLEAFCDECASYSDEEEDDDDYLEESLQKRTRSGKLIERRVKGKISPALKESVRNFETKKRLLENKIIDKKDMYLLQENDKMCARCGGPLNKSNEHYTDDGLICDFCYKFGIEEVECDCCGKIIGVSRGETVHTDEYENPICDDCWEEHNGDDNENFWLRDNI